MPGPPPVRSTKRNLGHPAKRWQANGLLILTGPVADLSMSERGHYMTLNAWYDDDARIVPLLLS